MLETPLEPIKSQNASKDEAPTENHYKWRIVWRNVFLISSVHILGLYGLYAKFYYIPKWQSFVFNVFQMLFHGFGITAGRHRLWSHRTYSAHRSVEIFLAIMAASAYEQSIYLWCRDHRLHHKHSDTDADPYNSRRGFFFSHVGWFFLRKHPEVSRKGATIDLSDLKANPVVMFEHKYNKPLALFFTLFVPCAVPIYFWGERMEIAIFYCCFWRLMLILHATWSVNSFAHIYGWRPYDASIQPVENIMVSLFSGGEGFHNYHHTFPWDYKAGELGGDTRNVTTLFIDFLASLGLVYDRKSAETKLIKSRIERTGNVNALSVKQNLLYALLTIVGAIIFI